MAGLNKYSGFVSNEYVIVSIARAVVVSVTLWVALLLINTPLPTVALLQVLPILMLVSDYFLAPMAFKRVVIDENGIRLGKETISYSQIKSLSIDIAYIRRYWGFKFIENVTGTEQHIDIYCEEMICINCSFMGLDSSNSKIYIPKNKKTVELMRLYYPPFEGCLAEYTPHHFQKSSKEIWSDILRWSVIAIAFLSVLVILPIGLENKIAWGVIVFVFLLSLYIHENSHYLFANLSR